MSKRLEENDIIDSTTNNIVNNYGTINGNVIAAQYSMMSEKSSKESYKICPDFKNSERASHKLLCLAYDSQLEGSVDRIIQLVREALKTEECENVPDEQTIIFSKYMLAHFLLVYRKNDKEALNIINDIISFDEIKKDEEFYSDVLLEKAKVLVLSGKTVQARSALSLVERRESAAFWEAAGYVAFYEGDIEQTVKMFNEGMNNALKEYISATTVVDKKTSYQHYSAFLMLLGEIYREIQRPDLALSLWKKAIEASDKIGWQKEKARLLLTYVECLLQYERWEDALKSLEEAYNIKKNDNDNEFFLHYYNLKAGVYRCRNDQDKNDLQEAINSLYCLFNYELRDREKIHALRTIANIQAEHGYREEALNTLKIADQVIEESEVNVYKEEIDVQRNDIKESSIFLDNRVRHTIIPPTLDKVNEMVERYNTSEIALERLHLGFDIGMGYIDIDADLSYNWLSDTVKQAKSIWNNSMAARALIGQASILFGKRSEEAEKRASIFIDDAIEIMKNIPIWDIRARAVLFKGLLTAHRENFKEAYQCFKDAQHMIDAHKVQDQSLRDYISDYMDECDIILSKKRFTDLDFATVIDEMQFLENWFPKYRKELRQFLWYNRYEDIERLIISSHGSKAFMVSDDEEEIQEWLDGVDSLFDIVSFTCESDYHIEENWNCGKVLPVPRNMKSKFLNIFMVLNI